MSDHCSNCRSSSRGNWASCWERAEMSGAGEIGSIFGGVVVVTSLITASDCGCCCVCVPWAAWLTMDWIKGWRMAGIRRGLRLVRYLVMMKGLVGSQSGERWMAAATGSKRRLWTAVTRTVGGRWWRICSRSAKKYAKISPWKNKFENKSSSSNLFFFQSQKIYSLTFSFIFRFLIF